MQDSGMLKTEVFNLAAAGRISARCGELAAARKYFEKNLLIGPHYSGWVKISYARLLARMQLFDKTLAFTAKYRDSEFSIESSKLAMQLFRAYALAKQNKPQQTKKLIDNILTQSGPQQNKRFFERTLSSAQDSDFIYGVINTLETFGFENS